MDVHWLHIVNQCPRASLADHVTDGRRKGRRIPVGPYGPPRSSLVVYISVSDVKLFAAGFDQRCVALMGHHTNDLSPLSLGRTHAIEDAFAHSRLIWKCLSGQCLI